MDFIAFDFETTDKKNPLPIEIGMVKVRNGEVRDSFQSLIHQTWISPMATAIHGLTVDNLIGAPQAVELIGEVMGFVEGLPLVAHNARFDASAAKASGLSRAFDGSKLYCSLQLARQTASISTKNYKLETLAECLGISTPSHRALADATTVAQLVLQILKDEKFTSLHDLYILKGLRPGSFKNSSFIAPQKPQEGNFQITAAIRESMSQRLTNDMRIPHPKLVGQEVVITGELKTMTRAEATELAIRMGAKPVDSLNKRTRFMVTGEKPGKSKLEKLSLLRQRGFEIVVLSESEFVGFATEAGEM